MVTQQKQWSRTETAHHLFEIPTYDFGLSLGGLGGGFGLLSFFVDEHSSLRCVASRRDAALLLKRTAHKILSTRINRATILACKISSRLLNIHVLQYYSDRLNCN